MNPLTTRVFDLPERLAAKDDPALIAKDERYLAAVAESIERSIEELTARLDAARKTPAGRGQQALDRDQEVHRLTARLRTLRRYGVDLCLGRIVTTEGETVYIGRLGLTDDGAVGRRLLVDWRAPAAEPFFAATHADPMGLVSRRRYRWTRGRITDYWDEVFTADGLEGNAALDDQSAFVASLGASRSPRMRDVLGTIQADQNAIVRADSHGALVVDGGPGTGKTVVALHRTAYLLYHDPRLGHRRGGVLFVGPHQPYLAYVSDVLPSLGEEGVRTSTLRDLVPEGVTAAAETDPEVARLKASAGMVRAIEPAVGLYETPPSEGMLVETPWDDVWLAPEDWAEAFAAAEPGTPHNDARDQVWDALVDVLADKLAESVAAAADDGAGVDTGTDTYAEEHSGGYPGDHAGASAADDQFDAYGLAGEPADAPLRRALAANRDLARAFGRAWPLLEPTDLVGDLWSVPAYLRRCAPWLTRDEVGRLQRPDAQAWTTSDLPLLDAARLRLGDPEASRRRRRQEATAAAERERMSDVVEDLIATDDSDLGVMSMLRGQDLRAALVDDAALPAADPDLLAGPFAHVVVDEAQELTDAEWQMLLARCPSRSFTIVGDRAQARHGFTESWPERLERVGFTGVEQASLSINYRTPQEVMAEAEPVIRAELPDANVPTSVRGTGVPVRYGPTTDLVAVLREWLAGHAEGTACVVAGAAFQGAAFEGTDGLEGVERVRWLTPETVKGLEFDLVVLVDPETYGTGIEGAVDRYVAMTRATQRLVVLTS
ncbi:HelD family protein [Myceligenerans pegani]|uniref:AAA family ATPase n=1 Tax=Myceligenerans pegani TaxID=2776917 RepID=A0ABR9N0T0_9MICO|nr:AAA family ATPase [Myceligenerans sp. TRM 65318]MBE1877263.1 AAA family ATPase [Myceligenerans sp. TRM 65318]MBE3019534.1 AAA family ATPase [Myceligenerans sp. TRM 65318]